MPIHLFFFYATIILLPTQLGYHFWPDWALVLGRRLDYLSPTIFLTDVTILLTLTSWFFSSFSSNKIKNLNLIKNFKSLVKLLARRSFSVGGVGLVVLVGLNIYFATSPLVALYKWFKVLEFVVFGFYIIKTKPSFSRSLWCLLFAVFYSSIIAIAQFFLQHSVGGMLWLLGERTFDVTNPGIARIQLLPISLSTHLPINPSIFSELLRPYATFPHPNVLGGFLAVSLPLIIINSLTTCLPARQVKQLNNWQVSLLKLFRVYTIILGTLALILTFSRSAWIAGAIGMTFLLFNYYKRYNFYKFYKIIAFVGFVVFVGFFLAFPYFQSLTSNSESVFVRNELNSAAISMWWKSSSFLPLTSYLLPRLFGVGLGNFLVKLPTYYPHRDIFFLQPVHNIYLLILSETGIIGSGIILYLLYSFLKRVTRKRLFVICHLSFVILLLLGAVDHYPLTLQQGQLLLSIIISYSLFSNTHGWRG